MPLSRLLSRLAPVLLLVLGACRAAHVPATAAAGCHPACAGAPTARVADAGAGLRGEVPPPALEREEGMRPASPKAYLCPMHPQVGADEPGRCPECGMKLVPRDQVLEHDHGR